MTGSVRTLLTPPVHACAPAAAACPGRYAVPLVFYTLQRRWTTHRPMLQMFAETAAEAERESDSRYGGSSADLLKHDIMELQGIRIDGGGGGGRVAVEAAGGGGGLGESAPLLASSMEAGGFRAKLGPSSLGWDPAARAHIVSVVNNGGAAGGNGTAGNGGWGDSSEGNGALLAAGRAATGPMVRTRSAAAMSQQQGNGGGGGADGSFAASSALPAAPSLAPAHEDASSEYDDGPRHHSSAGHHASSLRGSTCRVS